MRKQSYVLRDFVPNDGHWMVKGVGRLLRSANNQSFKSTEVILGKIDEALVSAKQYSFKNCSEIEFASHQNISNISLFTPGSVWESTKGISSLVCSANTANKYFQFSQHGRPQFVRLSDIYGDAELAKLGFGTKSKEAFYLSVSRPGQPHYILIPCSEILRADYGSAPTLIQAAIASWIEFVPERFINTEMSTAVSNEGYTIPPFAMFTKGVSWKKDTIATLANMYFDKYCRSVQAATYSSVVESIDATKMAADIKLKPLSNKFITMGAIVDEVPVYLDETPNATRYIVRKILHWDAPLPIKKFSYRIEMDNTKAPSNGPLKRFAFPKRRTLNRKLNLDPTEVLAEEQADASKQARIIGLEAPTKPEIARIECVKIAKVEQKYERDMTPPKEHDDIQGSTGETTYQDNLPPVVVFETKDVDEGTQRTPDNLITFASAVLLLQKALLNSKNVTQVNIRSIKLDGGWQSNHVVDNTTFWVNPFPSKVGTKESSRFAYVTKPPIEIPRTYMMIELTVDSSVFVLIETERCEGDKIPTYIACKKSFNPFILHEYKQLIGCMSVSKSSIFPMHSLLQIHRQRVNHVNGDTAVSLQARLKNYILNAFVYDEGRLVIPPNVSNNLHNNTKVRE